MAKYRYSTISLPLIYGYVHLQRMQFTEIIRNAYQWQRALYQDVIAAFVNNFMVGKEYLNPQFQASVNA